MRVTFDNHVDFLREVTIDKQRIRDQVIRARVDRVPEQAEAITFEVWMHLSAVIADENGDYLLEFSGRAGSDDEQSPKGGTDRVNQWSQDVIDATQSAGLELRPGKIELV